MFAGLEACYMMDLSGKASGAKKATLASVISTYKRVFDTILALVAFTDPDKKFGRSG